MDLIIKLLNGDLITHPKLKLSEVKISAKKNHALTKAEIYANKARQEGDIKFANWLLKNNKYVYNNTYDTLKKTFKTQNKVARRPGYDGLLYTMEGLLTLPVSSIATSAVAGTAAANTIGNGISKAIQIGSKYAPLSFEAMMPSGLILTAANGLTLSIATLPRWLTIVGKGLDAATLAGFTTKGISDLSNKENWKPNSKYTSGANSIPEYIETGLEVAPGVKSGIDVTKNIYKNLSNPHNYTRAWNNISIPFKNFRDLKSGELSKAYKKLEDFRNDLSHKYFNISNENYDKARDIKTNFDPRYSVLRQRNNDEGELIFNSPYEIYTPISIPSTSITHGPTVYEKVETPIEIISRTGKPIKGIKTQYKSVTRHSLKFDPNGTNFDDLYVTRNTFSPYNIDKQNNINLGYRNNIKSTLLYSENNPEFNQALLEEMNAATTDKTIPVGSTRLIAKGYIGGAPGDLEQMTTKSNYPEVAKYYLFEHPKLTANGTGYKGHSSITFVGTDGPYDNLDINTLENNGTLIHLFESTRNPKLMPPIYSNSARDQSHFVWNGDHNPNVSANLLIPKPEGGYYTAEEYFNILKNNDALVDLHLIDNMFKSNKNKHIERASEMIRNPKFVNEVKTAILHMYDQVEGSESLTQHFPKINWNDVETNKNFLNSIGFNGDIESTANNPDMMKNIADYWYLRKTIGARSVNYNPTKSSATLDEVINATRSFDNGSNAGGGGNFVLGNTFGGFTRDFTGYSLFHTIPQTDNPTLLDILNAQNREKYIFKSKEFNEAIKEANEKFKLNIKPNVIDELYNNTLFTNELLHLVDLKIITSQQADDYISYVAKKLKISGYRGFDYGGFGDYFGGMTKASETPHSIRNIDSPIHNSPLLPAEFGSDKLIMGVSYQKEQEPITINVDLFKLWFYNYLKSFKKIDGFRYESPLGKDHGSYIDYSDVFIPRLDGTFSLTPEWKNIRKRMYFPYEKLGLEYYKKGNTERNLVRLANLKQIKLDNKLRNINRRLDNLKTLGVLTGILGGLSTPIILLNKIENRDKYFYHMMNTNYSNQNHLYDKLENKNISDSEKKLLENQINNIENYIDNLHNIY